MALQGKLLALTEDLEFFRKENNELRDKNEKLNKQVMFKQKNIYTQKVKLHKNSHRRSVLITVTSLSVTTS